MERKIMKNKQFWMYLTLINFVFMTFIGLPKVFAKEDRTKIIEGAKKEGQVVWYSSWDREHGVAVTNDFKKEYPFIKTTLFRLRAEDLLNKILIEHGAGKYTADVICFSLLKKEILQPYFSPERDAFPDYLKDEEGYWTGGSINTHVIAYNTRLVSKEDAPKNYQDLLDPKWKGKLAMDSKDYRWFMLTMKKMGHENGLEFMRKLAKQDLKFRRGHTLLDNLLIAGEFPVVVCSYGYKAEYYKSKGAPIEWVADEPVTNQVAGVGMAQKAPHPNAAKLLIDFIISKKGQEIIRQFNRIPARPDVLPNPPHLIQGLKLFPPYPEYLMEKYDEMVKLFREIFNQ